MAQEDLQDDIDKVRAARGTLQSVKVWIEGQAARLQAGIDAALDGGAPAASLQPLLTEINDTKAVADDVAAAIAANP